jgi:hypothetical protein
LSKFRWTKRLLYQLNACWPAAAAAAVSDAGAGAVVLLLLLLA